MMTFKFQARFKLILFNIKGQYLVQHILIDKQIRKRHHFDRVGHPGAHPTGGRPAGSGKVGCVVRGDRYGHDLAVGSKHDL